MCHLGIVSKSEGKNRLINEKLIYCLFTLFCFHGQTQNVCCDFRLKQVQQINTLMIKVISGDLLRESSLRQTAHQQRTHAGF